MYTIIRIAIQLALIWPLHLPANSTGDISTSKSAPHALPSITLPQRPNIILILADDLGWSDIGSYGSEINTPNLDKLAKNGISFTQFHNTSKCSTSRASLLTGLYAQQVNMGHLRIKTLKNSVTLGEVLRDAGYATLAVGKHHGKDNLFERGFDHYWGLRDGATNHFNPGKQRTGEPAPALKFKPRVWCFDSECSTPYTPKEKNYYSSDTFTTWAIEFLNQHQKNNQLSTNPFFLYLSYQAPHDPLQAWPEDIAKYRGKYLKGYESIAAERYKRQRKSGLIDSSYQRPQPTFRDWSKMTPSEQDDQDLRMAVYAAMIDNMDKNIGRLMGKLATMGLSENTIVIFASDNGSNPIIVDKGTGEIGSIDRWASLGGDWANVSNTPLKYFKNYSFQGGISTPLIVQWPEGINRRGTVSDFPGHFIDIMPTLLEVSGADYPVAYRNERVLPYEGVSLIPILKNHQTNGNSRYLTHQPRTKPLFWQWGLGRAVRDGKWKIVSSDRTSVSKRGEWRLYDMSKDKSEINDLSDEYPEVVENLSEKYELWWQSLPESRDGDYIDYVIRVAFWVSTLFEKTSP